MQAAPPLTISYLTQQGQARELEIPSNGLAILKPGDTNRRLFTALVAEAGRRRTLDNSTYSLIKSHHLITSALPPITVISLHALSRSSQPLYQLLSLEESLSTLARESGAVCPACEVEAPALSLFNFFPSLVEFFQGQSVTVSLLFSGLSSDVRTLFPEIIRNGIILDTLDLADDELAADASVVGVLYRGRISPERRATIQDALSVCHDYPQATLQIRGTEPPFPVLRHLGFRPTCPQCGHSTYPITRSSLCSFVKEFARKQEESPLLWYPRLRDLLFCPPADSLDHQPYPSALTAPLRHLSEFGITANLAAPISELSLRERLCLRFLPVTPSIGGILLLELPSYGVSEHQVDALKRWVSHQKRECAAIIALGGDDLIGDIAELIVGESRNVEVQEHVSPGVQRLSQKPLAIETAPPDISELLSRIAAQPSHLFSVTPGEGELIADAILRSSSPESPWKIVDIGAILLDRNVSSRPLLVTLPLFRRLTALYAQVTAARVLGITARALTLTGPQSERCEECLGRGKIVEESHAITCVRCAGSRFKPHIEQLTFRGLPFPALFTHTAEALSSVFSSVLPIAHDVDLLIQIGLGHIVLGTPEDNLPPDIRLRSALLTACANSPKGAALLIRGVAGILSPEELAEVVTSIGSLAARRSLRIIHDGALPSPAQLCR